MRTRPSLRAAARAGLVAIAALAMASAAHAQTRAQTEAQPQTAASSARDPIEGHVSLTADYLPNVGDALELRARLFVERRIDAGPNVQFFASGWAEGLVADRGAAVRFGPDGSRTRSNVVRDAVARPHEAYVDVRAGAFDVRAGLSTIVWGRLDEVQPSDVVNPLDISRYLFEGRAEARLPVPLVRARWFASDALSIDGVWVPLFRRGRADFLDEQTSPFDLLNDRDPCRQSPACPPIPIDPVVSRDEPARTLGHSQGGVRVSATTGRVDWSMSAYRGFEPFGVVTFAPESPASGSLRLTQSFPRFTMIAGDVETVRGAWILRGEAAGFVDTRLQSPDAPLAERGRSIEGGGSLERKAGDYRINAAVLVRHDAADTWSDTDVRLVTGAQRSFARDTRRLMLFGVWNAGDAAGFLRTIAGWNVRDNYWIEGSVGWFFGDGTDTLSRFGTRDFAYLRLKAYF